MLNDKSVSALQETLGYLVDDFDLDYSNDSLADLFNLTDYTVENHDSALYDCMDYIESNVRQSAEAIKDECGALYGILNNTKDNYNYYIAVNGVQSRDLTKSELILGIENILDSDKLKSEIYDSIDISLGATDTNDTIKSYLENAYPYLNFNVHIKDISKWNPEYSYSNFNDVLNVSVK